MILVTHGVIGAAVGRFFPNQPWLAFILGFFGHFLIDAIPHWHYPLLSGTKRPGDPLGVDMMIGKKFVFDLISIGLDFSAGIILAIWFFQGWVGFSNISASIFFGAVGGMIPDAFHFLYMKWRHEPLYSFERFHVWIHSKINIDQKHFLGISSQVLIIIMSVFLSGLLKPLLP